MTEAGWTHEAPSKEGWYWMRAPKHGWRDCVMWVEKDEDGFYIDVGDCDSEYVADIDGEWLGPITPDSYQQGRVEGAKEVLESFTKHHDSCSDFRHCECAGGFWYEHIGKPWKDEKDALQAQQAQKEKGVGDANIKMS